MTTRGVRNFNPGNLRHSKDKWEGLSDIQNDDQFCVFVSPEYGIRALAKTLMTYQTIYGLDTIAEIINRWAPQNENDTASYISSVAKSVGISKDCQINIKETNIIEPMVKAIIKHENGEQPYSDSVIMKALDMAGVRD